MATNKIIKKVKQIDRLINLWYESLNNYNYYGDKQIGAFYYEFTKMQLNNAYDVPMEWQLGINAEPGDCEYHLLFGDIDAFPLPETLQHITPKGKELFIFYLLQHFYLHEVIPTKEYFGHTILLRCKFSNELFGKS